MFLGFCSFALDERIWQTICPALFFKVEANFDQGLISAQLLVSLNLFKSKICFDKRFGIGCQKEAAKCKGNVLEDKRPSREGLGVLGKVTSFEPLLGVTLWIIHCDHDLVGFQNN